MAEQVIMYKAADGHLCSSEDEAKKYEEHTLHIRAISYVASIKESARNINYLKHLLLPALEKIVNNPSLLEADDTSKWSFRSDVLYGNEKCLHSTVAYKFMHLATGNAGWYPSSVFNPWCSGFIDRIARTQLTGKKRLAFIRINAIELRAYLIKVLKKERRNIVETKAKFKKGLPEATLCV